MPHARSTRFGTALGGLVFDFRQAVRGLARDWGLSASAVLMLTLALALNAATFTLMQAMLFRGLPQASRGDRLAYLAIRTPATRFGRLSYADFEAYRSQASAFVDLAFSGGGGPITFRDPEGRPTDTVMSRISTSTFRLIGVRPMLGRDFAAADEAAGAAPVAIVSHHFWSTRLAGRPDVVGSIAWVNDTPVTIVGVMPEGFLNVYEQNLWMPVAPAAGLAGGAFGRLRDGSTFAEAQAQLETIYRQLEAEAPVAARGVPQPLTYSQAYMSPDAPMTYGSLWAGAWFVLFIACANLANLLLARTVGRAHELSTRLALGAGRWRVLRQIVLESLALAAVAGTFAWALTRWSVHTWATATASRYLALDYTVDSGILAYLAAIAIAAAVLCSLPPLFAVARLAASRDMKGPARGSTLGVRGKRVGATLVFAQTALAIVLLAAAGVLARSLVAIVGADTGVRDPDQLLVGFLKLPSATYPDDEARRRYVDRLQAQLRSVPGVDAQAVASSLPANNGYPRTIEVEGQPVAADGGPRVHFLSADASYFRVIGVEPRAGRAFGDGDHATSLPVAIVNQSFADAYWPGREAIGRRIRSTDQGKPGEWWVVVGVVPNILQGDPLRQQFKPVIYLPFRQRPSMPAISSAGCCFRGTNFLLRTSVAPALVAPAVRAAIQQVDADVTLEDFSTLRDSFAFDRDRMDIEHAELGKHAAVAPVLAAIALLLAALGLYAVVAHAVGQRTREIGVRMAIGASARDVLTMVMREGLRPVALGLIAGLAASFGVNRLLQSQLVGVSPYDPVTLTGTPVLLLVIALLACLVPARRAMRIEPMEALRHE